MTISTHSEKTAGRSGGGPRGGGSQNAFNIFTTALSTLQGGRCAVPFLLLFALRLAVIMLYAVSVDEPLSSFWALLVGGLTGEDVSHYPAHLILMPAILSRFDFAFDILVSVLFQGATVALVASAYRGRSVSVAGGFSDAARGYRGMVLVMFIISIALFACLNLPRLIPAGAGRILHLAGFGVALVLGLAVQAVFLYALPGVVLERRNAFAAIAASARIARGAAVTTFLLVALPFILTVPTMLLGFKAELIALRISPEFLLINQVMGEIMYLIATYLIIGGATIVLARGGSNGHNG